MIHIVLPDIEFETLQRLCHDMAPTAEIIKFSNNIKYEKGDIIFNLTRNKLIYECITFDLDLLWEKPEFCKRIFNNAKPISKDNEITVIISTYKRQDMLNRAVLSILNQGYPNVKIVVIGDKCPTLNPFSHPRVKTINLETNSNDGGCTPKNHGLTVADTEWITYLDDDNYFMPNHFLYIYERICSTESNYGLTSMIMGKYNIVCKEPKLYRVDTSCVVHRKSLVDKYGPWKSHKDAGYCHDFEFVSRWKDEPYFTTNECTMWYNLVGSFNNAKAIYEYYGDQ